MSGRTTAVAIVLGLVFSACGGGVSEEEVDARIAEAVANATSTTAVSVSSTSTTTLLPTATSTTLTDQEEADALYEEDVAKIKSLWREYSDVWFGGIEDGYTFIANHNHPDSECTRESFVDYLDFPEGFESEAVVDAGTVERDDAWVVPLGPGRTEIPRGRVYILQVTFTDFYPGDPSSPYKAEVHTAFLGGAPFFFYRCSADW